MKKYLILGIIIFSQIQSFGQKQLGIKGGYDLSNRTESGASDLIAPILPTDSDPLSSFYIGGYAEFSITDHISLSPELLYARRGRKLFYTQNNINITSVYHDLAAPVLVMFRILKRFQLYTGPEFSYVLSNHWEGTSGIGPVSGGTGSGSNKYERRFDIALSAGLSFEVIKNLSVDLRYNRGLLDQSKTYNIPGEFIGTDYAGQQIPVDYVAKNWSVEAGLKYNFLNRKD
jgi:hypothetical protein